MALYTVHVPGDGRDPLARADRTVFVREGFNARAFAFGWLFLLWHGIWGALAVWLVLGGALAALWWFVHVSPGTIVSLVLLMHLFVGIEGNDLRRWSLGRRGFGFLDVVSGSRPDEAEYSFFVRQPEERVPPLQPVSRVVARDPTPSVIGMFPDEGTA